MTEATRKTVVYHWLKLCCSYKTRTLLYYTIIKAKMAKYYQFLNFFFCKKTLFWNYIGKYHFLWYSSFLNSSA